MDERPLNVVSLSRKEFDNQRVKPDNYLFFVYEEYVSEDGKAKTKISLYKGSLLVCGDLYEAIEKINNKIDGNEWENNMEIGSIRNIQGGSPKAEIVYDKSRKKNKLNIGFPLRSRNINGLIGNTGMEEIDWIYTPSGFISIHNLYPLSIVKDFVDNGFTSASQIIYKQTIRDHALFFFEDLNQDKIIEGDVRCPVQTANLYVCDSDVMAVDYRKVNNFLYPIFCTGKPYIMSAEKYQIYIPNEPFEEKDDKYISTGNDKAYFCVEKDEFEVYDGHHITPKGSTGVINVILKEGLVLDELYRFHIAFETYSTFSKIEFKDEQDELVFNINVDEVLMADFAIEITPYGIRKIAGGWRGERGYSTPIIYSKHMGRIEYPYNGFKSVKKISFHWGKNDDYPFLLPNMKIRNGSVFDYINY